MKIKLICGGKFQFINQVIGLPVNLDNLPNKLIIDNNNLLLKTSFHVSLVCILEIVKKHNISISDFENNIINDFCEFIKSNNISLESYINNFKFCVQDDKKSIIVLCKITNLNKFFENVNKKYGLKIEYPPTHVTLYTLDGGKGIFLTDANDIKNLTKPIPNPIGRSL